MTLLDGFLDLTDSWRDVFPQSRTWQLAVRHALGSLVCLGRRCLSRILWTNGDQHSSWRRHYQLYSRSRWHPQRLFTPLLAAGLTHCPSRLVGIALDDTRLRKTGRCIAQAFYQHDPLSPPFHTNLMLGLRFLQGSLLLPLHRNGPFAARGIPICFEEVSVVKRPRKKAPKKEWDEYRKAVRQHNLSQRCVQAMARMRQAMEEAGGAEKVIVFAVDGSFCNRTVLGGKPEEAELVGRIRKDARLCLRAPAGSRRFYAAEKFTPEQVRLDGQRMYKRTRIFYGGKWRTIRYKEVKQVYWQGGGRRRTLRLLVVAPTPYRKRKSGRLYYRDPAYLISTDLTSPAKQLLQIYFDRWQIEVNHREEKDTLGVGQAQLWNPVSVPKQPPLAVAAYSALLLAGLKAYGPERGSVYAALPKWRSRASRPSCLDLITLLRQQMAERPDRVAKLHLSPSYERMTTSAAA